MHGGLQAGRHGGGEGEEEEAEEKEKSKGSRADEHVNCGTDPQGLGSQRGRTDDGDRHGDGGPCGGAGLWEGVTWGVMDVQLIFASVRPPRTHRALLVVEEVVAPDGVSECRHMAGEGRGQTGRPGCICIMILVAERGGDGLGWDGMGSGGGDEVPHGLGWAGMDWRRARVGESGRVPLQARESRLWTVATRMLLWPGGRPRRASLD